jgi:hypothetical protein
MGECRVADRGVGGKAAARLLFGNLHDRRAVSRMRDDEQPGGLSRKREQAQPVRTELRGIEGHGGTRRGIGEIQVQQHHGTLGRFPFQKAVPIQQ